MPTTLEAPHTDHHVFAPYTPNPSNLSATGSLHVPFKQICSGGAMEIEGKKHQTLQYQATKLQSLKVHRTRKRPKTRQTLPQIATKTKVEQNPTTKTTPTTAKSPASSDPNSSGFPKACRGGHDPLQVRRAAAPQRLRRTHSDTPGVEARSCC